MKQERNVSRHSFLDWLIRRRLIVWALGFLTPVVSYIRPAQRRGPMTEQASAGRVNGFEVWSAKIMAVGSQPVIVSRMPQEFRADAAVCTHLGCIVDWNATEHEIDCPCQAGRFDFNGQVVTGPPPRPLPKESVRVVNDEVIVQLA